MRRGTDGDACTSLTMVCEEMIF